jgi:hypothetical protein
MRLYIVLDIGCLECGEDTRVVSIYPTLEGAEESATRYAAETGRERDEVWNGSNHRIEIHAYTGDGSATP